MIAYGVAKINVFDAYVTKALALVTGYLYNVNKMEISNVTPLINVKKSPKCHTALGDLMLILNG